MTLKNPRREGGHLLLLIPLISAHPAGIDQARRLVPEGTPLLDNCFISNPEGTQLILQHLRPILDDERQILETFDQYLLEPLSSQNPIQ